MRVVGVTYPGCSKALDTVAVLTSDWAMEFWIDGQ